MTFFFPSIITVLPDSSCDSLSKKSMSILSDIYCVPFQILIPVQIVQNVSQKGGASGSGPTTPLLPKHNNENNASSGGSNKSVGGTKAKKLGSLGLFFRKVL